MRTRETFDVHGHHARMYTHAILTDRSEIAPFIQDGVHKARDIQEHAPLQGPHGLHNILFCACVFLLCFLIHLLVPLLEHTLDVRLHTCCMQSLVWLAGQGTRSLLSCTLVLIC
jgi:hypothetical protein